MSHKVVLTLTQNLIMNALTLAQKKFIEKQLEKGLKSNKIAEELGVSIWTVRKWQQRIKKGLSLAIQWVDPFVVV